VSNENPSKLPAGYALDLVDDPCVIVLRRGGGAIVARFTRNVDPQEIRRAAEEDRAENGRGERIRPRSVSRYESRGETQRS
jgi:hypothetical protein